MFTEEFTSATIALVALVGSVLGGFVIWFIKEVIGKERAAKVNQFLEKSNLEFILQQQWAKEAVQYAEQSLKNSNGAQKLNAVLDFLTKKANDLGIKVNRTELEILVEAQVKKVKEGAKEGWTQINTNNPVIVEETKTDPLTDLTGGRSDNI